MKFLVAVSLIVVASSNVGAKYLSPSPRIVNGTKVADNKYPFQVSVQMVDIGHWCGGAIITPNYVITAAHCNDQQQEDGTFEILPASFYNVRVGSDYHGHGGHVVYIDEIIRHPAYNPYGYHHDIAIWRLATPLTFSKSVKPISLATAPPPSGSKVTVVGWGRIHYGGPIPSRMLEAAMYAMSNEDCGAYIYLKKHRKNDTDGILCLARKGVTGVCKGDSGGAAIYENTLVGLSSFSFTDADTDTDRCLTTNPDMFANVPQYIDWIKDNSDWSQCL